MNIECWDAYLSLNKKTGADVTDDPASMALFAEFIDRFHNFLEKGRILAPGAVMEALLLAKAGYDVHALVLGTENYDWLASEKNKQNINSLVIRDKDAHELDYPPNFFDGYFSVQTHEHLMAPLIHIGEVRSCMKDGAIVFVDACGTTNSACKAPWHVNLVPERTVRDQWEFWGFQERWHGSQGDDRPQFIFEKLPNDHPDFLNRHAWERITDVRLAAV